MASTAAHHEEDSELSSWRLVTHPFANTTVCTTVYQTLEERRRHAACQHVETCRVIQNFL